MLQVLLLLLGTPMLVALEIFLLEVHFRYKEEGLNPIETIKFWFIRKDSFWKSREDETFLIRVENKIFKVYTVPVLTVDDLSKKGTSTLSAVVKAPEFFKTYKHIKKEEAKEIVALLCLAKL